MLEEPELKVLQVSSNIKTYLGLQPQDLLDRPLSNLIDPQQAIAIAQMLAGENGGNPLKLSISTDRGERYFDAIAYRTADAAILELEPIDSPNETSFLSFQAAIARVLSQIQRTSNLSEFLQLIVEEVRKLTGFDRIMVYQFAPTGAGCVVAETKRGDLLPPYLGLHYPATDIPQPARELYARCWLRFIPDISAQAVDLVTLNQQPIDLSLSILRSVDACCVEYHRNMGVAALLAIALMQEQQLWGLIACHHYTPKYLTSEVRIACKFLGQLVSLELANKIRQQELSDRIQLKSLQSELIESISQASNFVEALIQPAPRLLSLTNATGAAVCLGNEISLVGATPSLEEVRSLVDWADTQVSDRLFATDSLPQIYPPSLEFQATASGLLLLRISKIRRYYILWFRPEVIQTVTWAGDPNLSIQPATDGSMKLSPRRSFEQWQETVKFKSLPWKSYEIDSANDLKTAIVGVVLRKAEELAQINQELERSNRELAAFAYAASHDLKEPLRGIYNYSTILLEDCGALLDLDGVDCLQTIKRLSQRMEALIDALLRLSLLGKAQLNLQATDLNELLQQAIAVLFASRPEAQLSVCIPRSLPIIECDPILVSEVFSNLISNALKYNDTDVWVEIGYQEQLGISPIFYVRDNGIGIQAHHHETIFKLFKRLHSQEKYGGGTGAGLAIVKKIVELHGGRIWVDSVPGSGATFYFSLK